MDFLRTAADYLLGGPRVGGASEERLRRWLALPEQELALPHARARYVVVDTATADGDSRRGRLIAIGAVGVDRTLIELVDCFTTVLRQPRGSAGAGVPVHGTGGQAQPAGTEPELALLDFLEFLGKAPLVAFDASIASTVLERAVKSILGVAFRHPWVDLAAVLPALFPKAGCTTRAAWLQHFGLGAGPWQDALGDAFVTAQLCQPVLEASARSGMVNAAQLIAVRRR